MLLENIGKIPLFATLIIGACNLITPFIGRPGSSAKSFALISATCAFFINVAVIDFFFLEGARFSFNLISLKGYSLAFHLEALGLIFLNLIGFLWIFSLIYTINYLRINDIPNPNLFLFFVNLTVLCGICVALSANLLTMAFFYEAVTFAAAPLIIHTGGQRSVKGMEVYLKTLSMASLLLFMPAVLFITTKLGNVNFVYGGFTEGKFSDLGTSILFLAIVFGSAKNALFPLHSWLPSAMVAAYPVSALLHAVIVVKTGLFCLFKIIVCVFGLNNLRSIFGAFDWPLLFPILTIVYASYKALKEREIKRLLAYSTINQLSLALAAAFLFTPKALGAAVLHMVSHSFSKIALFFSTGNFYSFKRTYSESDLSSIKNSLPINSLFFLVAGASLIGFPPFAGFISKLYAMVAAAEENRPEVILAIAFASVCSGIYLSRLALYIYRPGKISLEDEAIQAKEKTNISALSVCVSCVVFFIFISNFVNKFLINLR